MNGRVAEALAVLVKIDPRRVSYHEWIAVGMALIERCQRCRSRAMQMTSLTTAEPGQRKTSYDALENCICEMIELEEELEAEIATLREVVARTRAVIAKVADERLRDLLGWRYLNGWRWSRIADAMHYDVRWVCKLHEKALLEMEAVLEAEGEA